MQQLNLFLLLLIFFYIKLENGLEALLLLCFDIGKPLGKFTTHTRLTQIINGFLLTQSYCHYSAQSCFCDFASQINSSLRATNVRTHLNTN